MKIYLSPSSQKNNAYSYEDYTESYVCGEIAEHAKQALKRNGYNVSVGSNQTTYQQRVAESNAWGADIHIAIHTNAGGGDGTLVLCHSTRVNNKYVKSIYDEVAKISPGKDDGIRSHSNYEISKTKCLCVYLECEFHDNKHLAEWIVKNVDELGEAIAKGVTQADNKTFIANKKQENEAIYRVQVGAFKDKNNAYLYAERLKELGFDAFVR